MKKKKMDKTYTITLNHKQLRVLEEALDLHTRISIGQLDIVSEFLCNKFFNKFSEKNLTQWDIKEGHLDPLKERLFGLQRGASYGIGSPEVSEDGKVAYEMSKKCQNTIAKVEGHRDYSVWRHEPLKLSNEPLITIEEK